MKVTPQRDGVVLAVKVVPRAARNELAGFQGDLLRVRLTAPPVEGAANQALVRFLADLLGVSRQEVEIVAGQAGRQKLVKVHGLSPEQVIDRLVEPCTLPDRL